MEKEIKELLEANLKLSQENNELLKKVRRVQKRAYAAKIAYWVIILLVAFGAYYYIQPYVGKIENAYNQGVTNLQQFKDLANMFSDFGSQE